MAPLVSIIVPVYNCEEFLPGRRPQEVFPVLPPRW